MSSRRTMSAQITGGPSPEVHLLVRRCVVDDCRSCSSASPCATRLSTMAREAWLALVSWRAILRSCSAATICLRWSMKYALRKVSHLHSIDGEGTDRRKYTTTHDTKTRFPQISSSVMMACCHGVVLLKSTGERPVPVAALTQTKSASTKRILNSPLEAQKMEAATRGMIVLGRVCEYCFSSIRGDVHTTARDVSCRI